SFVCDHIETLYEVDIYYRQVAEEEGLEFARAGVPNDSDTFIAALADLVLRECHEHFKGGER
ncbi:MAG: ferrochelatase, partial [Deltaproteobacteria bacterium]